MRNSIRILSAVVLLGSALVVAASQAQDPIKVDLNSFKFKVPADKADLFGYNEGEGKLFFYTNGAAEAKVKVPADGDYEVVIKASCDSAQNERAKFKVSIDGKAVGKETLLTDDGPKEYKLSVKLKAGDRKLAIEFTNDAYKENEYDRNLYVHEVKFRPAEKKAKDKK